MVAMNPDGNEQRSDEIKKEGMSAIGKLLDQERIPIIIGALARALDEQQREGMRRLLHATKNGMTPFTKGDPIWQEMGNLDLLLKAHDLLRDIDQIMEEINS